MEWVTTQIVGQKEYQLGDEMHLIKSVTLNGVPVEFEVWIKLPEIQADDYRKMILTSKEYIEKISN